MRWYLFCKKCKKTYEEKNFRFICPSCKKPLSIKKENLEYNFKKRNTLPSFSNSIWKYKELFPLNKNITPITLGEGGTPLIDLSKKTKNNLYLKHEGLNPTGSFKDRGMSILVTKAKELNVKSLICASTGNRAVSLSAYGSSADISVKVIVPKNTPLGKLIQCYFYGSEIYEIDGSFDDGIEIVEKLILQYNLFRVDSVNPFKREGLKTIVYEIYEQLDFEEINNIILPVGAGGNFYSIYEALTELLEFGIIDNIPRLHLVQAKGASPIVRAFENNKKEIKPIKNPKTIASGIRVGNPTFGNECLEILKKTNGEAISVNDEEIREGVKELAKYGIGTSYTGVVSYCGLKN